MPWCIGELRVDLDAAMGFLDRAEVDLCRDLLELTILEIAQLRGIPRGTLYDALRRIREKLGPILSDYIKPAVRQNEGRSGNRRGE
jgi:DNA-directed RNA polymerase specialized sigma24 family protein